MKSAYYTTPLGVIRMDYEDGTLYGLKSSATQSGENEPCGFTDGIYRQICEYLDGKRKTFDVNYVLRGTPFRRKVWHILGSIGYGETLTYGQVAALAGNKKAARAVGGACNKNPVWLIVPCHRVIGAGGALTGYGGGLEMKSKLLAIEKNNK